MFRKGARTHLRRIRRGRTALPLVQSLESRALLSTIHVDANAPGTTQDGSSWDTAYLDLQAALAVATAGDEIRVANGVYKPTSGTDRTISFQMKSGLSLRGGFAGYDAGDPDEQNMTAHVSILSGEIGTSSLSDNSAHVVNASGVDSQSVLEGFTITRGRASIGFSGNRGAGIYNDGGSPQISDCILTDNHADEGGGGMLNRNASGVEVVRCTFSFNTGNIAGGGIGNLTSKVRLTSCSFLTNSGASVGANSMFNSSSAVELFDCRFSGNANPMAVLRSTASSVVMLVRTSFIQNQGLGISNEMDSSLTLDNCTFRQHVSGLLISNVSASMVLTNCLFTDNANGFANDSGSATVTDCTFLDNLYSGFRNTSALGTFSRCQFIRSSGITNIASSPTIRDCVFQGAVVGLSNENGSAPQVIQCTFSGNSSTAVYNTGNSTPTLVNCVISGNGSSAAVGAIHNVNASPIIVNCIVWGNNTGTPSILQNGGASNVSYSDIQGGFAGVGNINSNPQFLRSPSRGADNVWGTADDDYGVLRVKANSPCVDVGTNSAVPASVTIDVDGKPRIVDVPGVQPAGAIVDMGTHESPAPLLAVKGEYLYDEESPTVSMSFNFDLFDPTFITADLWILNPATGLAVTGLSQSFPFYDADLRRVRRYFSNPLPDGNYLGRMYSGGVGDHRGALLGETYIFEFYVLAGDANRDRKVDAKDLMILAANWMGTGKKFSQGDFNYDSVVDHRDLGILASRWQLRLDAPLPSAPIPTSSPLRSPARTPTRVMSLVEPAP